MSPLSLDPPPSTRQSPGSNQTVINCVDPLLGLLQCIIESYHCEFLLWRTDAGVGTLVTGLPSALASVTLCKLKDEQHQLHLAHMYQTLAAA